MKPETVTHADTRVSFTVTLPQELAEKIISQAESAGLAPDVWLQNITESLLEKPNLRIPESSFPDGEEKETAAELEDLIARTLGNEPKVRQIEDPNAANPGVLHLRREYTSLRDARRRAVHRLRDSRHSVTLTAKKREELEQECRELEEKQRAILDEVTRFPGDRDLIQRLDAVADLIDRAKYKLVTMSAQYHDAVVCQRNMQDRLSFLEAELSVLERKIAGMQLGSESAEEGAEMK